MPHQLAVGTGFQQQVFQPSDVVRKLYDGRDPDKIGDVMRRKPLCFVSGVKPAGNSIGRRDGDRAGSRRLHGLLPRDLVRVKLPANPHPRRHHAGQAPGFGDGVGKIAVDWAMLFHAVGGH